MSEDFTKGIIELYNKHRKKLNTLPASLHMYFVIGQPPPSKYPSGVSINGIVPKGGLPADKRRKKIPYSSFHNLNICYDGSNVYSKAYSFKYSEQYYLRCK